MKSDNLSSDADAWFAKAFEDEFAGVQILKAQKFAAPACFHFQQMAEKYLKGLIIFNGEDFPKLHDLLELETLLLSTEPDIKKLHNDLRLLNRYYVETRYPGDYPHFTIAECRKAHKAALRIKNFVIKKTKTGSQTLII